MAWPSRRQTHPALIVFLGVVALLVGCVVVVGVVSISRSHRDQDRQETLGAINDWSANGGSGWTDTLHNDRVAVDRLLIQARPPRATTHSTCAKFAEDLAAALAYGPIPYGPAQSHWAAMLTHYTSAARYCSVGSATGLDEKRLTTAAEQVRAGGKEEQATALAFAQDHRRHLERTRCCVWRVYPDVAVAPVVRLISHGFSSGPRALAVDREVRLTAARAAWVVKVRVLDPDEHVSPVPREAAQDGRGGGGGGGGDQENNGLVGAGRFLERGEVLWGQVFECVEN
jgi:hypothetical protein